MGYRDGCDPQVFHSVGIALRRGSLEENADAAGRVIAVDEGPSQGGIFTEERCAGAAQGGQQEITRPATNQKKTGGGGILWREMDHEAFPLGRRGQSLMVKESDEYLQLFITEIRTWQEAIEHLK